MEAPTSPNSQTACIQERSRSSCSSFRTTDGRDDLMVRYEWNGESIGLELMRLKTPNVRKVIHWTEQSLGITFGIESASRKVIVTRTDRDDIREGYVLVSAMGQQVTEDNFDEMMATLKRCNSVSRGIPFEFSAPPAPVLVKSTGNVLRKFGVDSSFELCSVDDHSVRYLSLEELHDVIKKASRPCLMIFRQRKDDQYLTVLREKSASEAAAAGALAGAALCCLAIC